MARLADAVAARYGIPAATLRDKLAAGRLRVKSNVDRATATTFAADLESLGAVCLILDAATNLPVPVAAGTPPPVAKAPPVAKPNPQSPLSGAAPSRPSQPLMASGLAAAFGTSKSQQDLGALESGEFSLSTLDGADDVGAAKPASYAPPAAPARSTPSLPASIGPAALPASIGPAVAKPAVEEGAAYDPFAPPDAAQETPLDLDVEPPPRRTGKVSEAPPLAATVAAAHAGNAPAVPALASEAPPRATSTLGGLVADPRARFAAGLLLAILIGFLPAHLVASMRESSAFERVDTEVKKHYAAVISDADYRALDDVIARGRKQKEDDRRNIALGSMLIWALVGGGFAFYWFRKIDWDAAADRFA